MNIRNPYQGVEHKVFKRTFLQEVEVGVEFEPQITPNDFSTRIVPFVNKIFSQNISEGLDKEIERVDLTSKDGQIKFKFNTSSARVSIASSAYKSFSSSVFQHISVLIEFLKEVAHAELIKDTYIYKVNVWPITSNNSNSKQAFSGASLFIFKKEHIEDIANLKFNEPDYPVKATKEAVVNCGEKTSLKAKISVELQNDKDLCFFLGLRAKTSDIEIKDLISNLPILNDIIFGAFTDIVSPNILELMSKENLS